MWHLERRNEEMKQQTVRGGPLGHVTNRSETMPKLRYKFSRLCLYCALSSSISMLGDCPFWDNIRKRAQRLGNQSWCGKQKVKEAEVMLVPEKNVNSTAEQHDTSRL